MDLLDFYSWFNIICWVYNHLSCASPLKLLFFPSYAILYVLLWEKSYYNVQGRLVHVCELTFIRRTLNKLKKTLMRSRAPYLYSAIFHLYDRCRKESTLRIHFLLILSTLGVHLYVITPKKITYLVYRRKWEIHAFFFSV